MRKWILLAVVALLIVGGIGYLAFQNNQESESPGEVVEAFWMAVNKGDYDTADALLTDNVKEKIGGSVAIYLFFDYGRNNLNISSIKIVYTQIWGNRAVVEYVLYCPDSSHSLNTQLLEERRDDWKINENPLAKYRAFDGCKLN